MKKTVFLAIASVLLAACSEKAQAPGEGRHEVSLRSVGVATRSSLDESSTAFSWTAGDRLSVFTGDGSSSEMVAFSTSEGGASTDFKGSVKDGYDLAGIALFPYNEGHSVDGQTLSFVLPAEYSYEGGSVFSADLPMLALFSDPAEVSFRHLGGAIRIRLKEVPAGASKFVFTSNRTDITGTFTSDLSADTPVISPSSVSDAGRSVTISFSPLAEKQAEMDFIIPMPVCTIYGWQFDVHVGDSVLSAKSGKASKVERCSVLEAIYSCVGMTGNT